MKARKRPAAPPIHVQIDDAAWRTLGRDPGAKVKRAVRLALLSTQAAKAKDGLTVLLTDDDCMRALNDRFRGKNKATNVLSFSSVTPRYLGDIVIASGVAAREAAAAGVPLTHHVLHLVVHGVLHLLGYDHESASDAEVMESLEAEILAEMKIPNPYLRRGCAA